LKAEESVVFGHLAMSIVRSGLVQAMGSCLRQGPAFSFPLSAVSKNVGWKPDP
jgi:hypothetical protein